MIVLDASAVLDLLLVTERGGRAAERIAPVDETLHAPHLVDLEVGLQDVPGISVQVEVL